MSGTIVDHQPFAIRAHLTMMVFGLFTLTLYGGMILLFLIQGWDLSREPKIWISAALWTPLSLWLILDRSEVVVDPSAGTILRRKGTWPFVREIRRSIFEIADVLEDTIQRKNKHGRMIDHNRLRLTFADGEEWVLLVEHHAYTKVRHWGERLSAATGLPLTSG